MIVLEDANGRQCVFEEEGFYRQLQAEKFTLFGFTCANIVSFRKLYMKLGGRFPVTEDTIEEVYSDHTINRR